MMSMSCMNSMKTFVYWEKMSVAIFDARMSCGVFRRSASERP